MTHNHLPDLVRRRDCLHSALSTSSEEAKLVLAVMNTKFKLQGSDPKGLLPAEYVGRLCYKQDALLGKPSVLWCAAGLVDSSFLIRLLEALEPLRTNDIMVGGYDYADELLYEGPGNVSVLEQAMRYSDAQGINTILTKLSLLSKGRLSQDKKDRLKAIYHKLALLCRENKFDRKRFPNLLRYELPSLEAKLSGNRDVVPEDFITLNAIFESPVVPVFDVSFSPFSVERQVFVKCLSFVINDVISACKAMPQAAEVVDDNNSSEEQSFSEKVASCLLYINSTESCVYKLKDLTSALSSSQLEAAMKRFVLKIPDITLLYSFADLCFKHVNGERQQIIANILLPKILFLQKENNKDGNYIDAALISDVLKRCSNLSCLYNGKTALQYAMEKRFYQTGEKIIRLKKQLDNDQVIAFFQKLMQDKDGRGMLLSSQINGEMRRLEGLIQSASMADDWLDSEFEQQLWNKILPAIFSENTFNRYQEVASKCTSLAGTYNGKTALFYALANNNYAAVQYLLQHDKNAELLESGPNKDLVKSVVMSVVNKGVLCPGIERLASYAYDSEDASIDLYLDAVYQKFLDAKSFSERFFLASLIKVLIDCGAKFENSPIKPNIVSSMLVASSKDAKASPAASAASCSENDVDDNQVTVLYMRDVVAADNNDATLIPKYKAFFSHVKKMSLDDTLSAIFQVLLFERLIKVLEEYSKPQKDRPDLIDFMKTSLLNINFTIAMCLQKLDGFYHELDNRRKLLGFSRDSEMLNLLDPVCAEVKELLDKKPGGKKFAFQHWKPAIDESASAAVTNADALQVHV